MSSLLSQNRSCKLQKAMHNGVMFSRNYTFSPGVSCFLLGPRGTGKTYWLHKLYPQAVYVDLLEARTFNALAADHGTGG
jgi:hypothetical protein